MKTCIAGFFSLGDKAAPGNMGLWDMKLALEVLRDVSATFSERKPSLKTQLGLELVPSVLDHVNS